jgi:dTDP-4-amino-4,6-dideoxygalactose transaminase
MYINWLNCKDYDLNLIDQKLESSRKKNHYTNYGPMVAELESWFKALLGIDSNKSVHLTSNGTTALHAIVSAMNIEAGRELKFATQDFTFPASVLGPLRGSLIVDMSSDHQVDLSMIGEEIDGLIITNVFGNSLDLKIYEKWADENDKILIIDNAATPYTFYKKKNTLNYGNASFISLHHTKPFGFGEGGFVVIDKKYSDKMERVLNFGFDADRNWNEWGSNYRMSDISAAFVFQHIERKFDTMIAHHAEIADVFSLVCKNNGWQMWNDKSDGRPFLSSLLFLTDEDPKKIKNLKNFEWKKYYKPLKGLQVSKSIYDRIICLPCHSDVTTRDILSLKR